MTAPDKDYTELVGWLRQRGHDGTQIERVLDQVRQYERETQADSVMDAIASGDLSLDDLIDQALHSNKPSE